jgi:hypothetical protein
VRRADRRYRRAVVRAPLVVAWLCLGTAATGGWVLVRSVRGNGDDDAAARRLPAVRRAADPFARWTVTEQFAAQHTIVIQVETRHLDDALAAARTIVAPLQDRYSEVMIYVHRPGRPDTLPPRRVQWTRAAGYVVTNFEQQ